MKDPNLDYCPGCGNEVGRAGLCRTCQQKRTMNDWAKQIYAWCERKGWNENLQLGNMVANLHTEISEAWEEYRNGHLVGEVYSSPNGKPEGFGVELADLIIRILHICALYNIDIDDLVAQKMAYNETRPYRHGGKVA